MKTTKTVDKKDTPAVSVRAPAGFAKPLECQIVSDTEIKLTQEKAKEILGLSTFQGERIVNDRHVQTLFNAWSSGRFMWEHVTLGLCECEGKTYRVNGQHTCWLRANINSNVDPTVRCVTYKVKNQEALRSLYATFDRNKTRSYGHIFKASLVGLPVARDVWPSVISHLGSGLRFWLYAHDSSEVRNVTPEDMVGLVENKFPDLFKKVAMFFQSKYDGFKPIRRRAAIAAIFATFDVAPVKALEFWDVVADGIGYKGKSDPRWHLRRYIEAHTSTKIANKSWVADERWYRTSISAWNKWRKNETVTHLKPTDSRVKPI